MGFPCVGHLQVHNTYYCFSDYVVWLIFGIAKTNTAYHSSRKQRQSGGLVRIGHGNAGTLCPGVPAVWWLSWPPQTLLLSPCWATVHGSRMGVMTETHPNNKSEIIFSLFGNMKTSVVHLSDFLRVFPILEFLKNWELLLNMTFLHTHWMVWTLFSLLTKGLG